MIQDLKRSMGIIIFCGGVSPVCLAVGPVDPDGPPPVLCIEDSICHINGCQATPDPDCLEILPEGSASSEPGTGGTVGSPSGTFPGTTVALGDTDEDKFRLTDNLVDFGGPTLILGTPLEQGSVQWSVVNGYYTPRLIGTLHLNNASGKFARMHMGSFNGAGERLDVDHSEPLLHALDNDHYSIPVNFAPSGPQQIVKVTVCTELSDNGINFDQVDCKSWNFGPE